MFFSKTAVSVVIPMYNAERHIRKVIEAILAQDYQGNIEVIVINDGSRDRSLDIIRELENKDKIKIIDQSNQGAVAATNNGFKAAQHDIICSIDSDVVLHKDWLRKVMEEFCDPLVGAVQGYYKTPKNVSFWARMMGYDVEKRYDDIKGKYVTHVCTGNTAYRKEALKKAGLFDPFFEYGYDNDMSYRLQKTGYKLVFKKDACCDHYWKSDMKGYIRQQYKSAYGRMQLIQKHRERLIGDSVSGLRMILQVPLTLLAALFITIGAGMKILGYSPVALWAGALFLGIIILDRLFFTVGIIKKQKDISALCLPFVHILRNIVWTWAFLRWIAKSLRYKS